jgi:hypothetical protein
LTINDVALWVNAVFELAWQRFPGSPLNAQRFAWNGSTSIPLDALSRFQQQANDGFRIDGIEGITNSHWYSVIDDLMSASIAAIDVLLALPVEDELPETTEPTDRQPECKGGLVVQSSAKVPLYDDDVHVGMVDLSELTKLCTSLLRQDKRLGTLYRDEAGRFIYHVWDYDDNTIGRTCRLMRPADAYEVALKADQFFVASDELIAELAKLKLDAQSTQRTNRPNAVSKPAEIPNPESSADTDSKLPKKLRKDSPSRVKAKAAHDYAMERIQNAPHMTIAELHAAILADPEVADMVPARADAFGTFLREAGVKRYKLKS